MLHSDLALALDPALLFRVATGNTPDPWQADLLRERWQRAILNCCRQSGKSSTVATIACHEALYMPGSLTLILSPSERQSKEVFRKTMDAYNAAGAPVPSVSETTQWLELNNGSRVLSLPGKERTLRGFSGVTLLIVDEASRVEDELYYSVRPMLAVSGGRLILLSTPFGQRGFFYEEWTNGGSDWKRVEVDAYQCPRISAEFLAEEKRALGPWFFEQEYGCRFMDSVGQIFSTDVIEAAITDEVQPLFFDEVHV